jgi:hypothetical protein
MFTILTLITCIFIPVSALPDSHNGPGIHKDALQVDPGQRAGGREQDAPVSKGTSKHLGSVTCVTNLLKKTKLQLNPLGKIPVLKKGKFILSESAAIATYVASTCDKTEKLYPSDAKIRGVIERREEIRQIWTLAHAIEIVVQKLNSLID